MSARGELFLGIIAAATLVTAMLQIGVLVAMGLLVRRVFQLVDHIDKELKPIFESVQSIAREASRAASLATASAPDNSQAMTPAAQMIVRVGTCVLLPSGPLLTIDASSRSTSEVSRSTVTPSRSSVCAARVESRGGNVGVSRRFGGEWRAGWGA